MHAWTQNKEGLNPLFHLELSRPCQLLLLRQTLLLVRQILARLQHPELLQDLALLLLPQLLDQPLELDLRLPLLQHLRQLQRTVEVLHLRFGFRFIIVYLKLNGAFWANCTIF